MKLWSWKRKNQLISSLLLLHLNAFHLYSILNQCWKFSSFCDQNFKEYNNAHTSFVLKQPSVTKCTRQFTLASLCFVNTFVYILLLFQTTYTRYKGKILKVIKSPMLQYIFLLENVLFDWEWGTYTVDRIGNIRSLTEIAYENITLN